MGDKKMNVSPATKYSDMEKLESLKYCILESETVYDIMAGAYLILQPDTPAKWANNNIMVTDESLGNAISLFVEQVQLYNINYAFAGLRNRLFIWFQLLNTQSVLAACYKLILFIDKECINLVEPPLPGSISRHYSLNTLFTHNYVILPRNKLSINSHLNTKSVKLRKRRAEEDAATMYGLLKNHIILEKKEKNPIIHVPYNSKLIIEKIIFNDYTLRIALFPLINKPINDLFVYERDDDSRTFSITCMKDGIESVLIERYLNAMKLCKKNHIDFAIFPELLSSKRIFDLIIDYIESGNPKDFPYITWLGSMWGNDTNICKVIDCYGNLIFEQHKQNPFDWKGYIEALSLEDQNMNFIDIGGIGRFATGICKDITDDNQTSLIRKMFTDFYVLPSFTESLDLTRDANALAKEHISVFCCNTCSARGRGDSISFISVPAKYEAENKAWVEYFKCCMSVTECMNECNNYIFELQFNIMEKNENNYITPRIKT